LGEGFWIFIFIFFILAPILERVLKGGVNAKRPPGQLPGQRPVPRRPLPGTRFPPGPTEDTAGEAGTQTADATDLIPSDLWAILTGQRRVEPEPPRPQPPPPPRPAPVATQPARRSYRPPAPLTQVDGLEAGSRDEEAAAADLLRRREQERRVQHAPPAIVSLESEPLPEAGRHRAFHDRLARLSTPAKVQRGRGPVDLHIKGRDELRRAILLREVLGPPKGLDD